MYSKFSGLINNDRVHIAAHCEQVKKSVDETIARCANVAQSCDDEYKVFVSGLSQYLKTRMYAGHSFITFHQEMLRKTRFASDILTLIESGNKEAIVDKLTEKNIKHFKGFFSKRFYTLLAKLCQGLELECRPSTNFSRKG